MSNIGIMNLGSFVGKSALLRWLNNLLELDYAKVEECGTGVAHCQFLDMLYPGTVPMHKVKFKAKHEYEFVQNFKVLQDVFAKENISKVVPVDKIVKARYQDNLEFLQWMKKFFDSRYEGQEYHPSARREQCAAQNKNFRRPSNAGLATSGLHTPVFKTPTRLRSSSATVTPKSIPKTSAADIPSVGAPAATASAPSKTKTISFSKTTMRRGQTTKPKRTLSRVADKVSAPSSCMDSGKRPTTTRARVSASKGGSRGNTRKCQSLIENPAEIRAIMDGLEKERDFYFKKLREIEILCQTDVLYHAATKQRVLELLYATDDDFASPPGNTDAAELLTSRRQFNAT